MGRLENKTSLITGASRGIGRAIAEGFGREGANVIVNYVSDEQAALDVVAAVKLAGGSAIAYQADTTDTYFLREIFEKSDKAFDGLDIVVLNAHPGLGHGAITKLEDSVIDEQLSVLKSYVIALQEAGRRVRDNGVIICISSSATRVAIPEVSLYGSIKLAIEHLARGLSRELAERGVRVVSVAPGLTRTDRMTGLDFGAAPVCEPEDIANAVTFLVSASARWVNTTTFYVNGGSVYAQ